MTPYSYSLHQCPRRGSTPHRLRHIKTVPTHELSKPNDNWYFIPRIQEWRVKQPKLPQLSELKQSYTNSNTAFLDSLEKPETPDIAVINEQIKELLQVRANLHCKGQRSSLLSVRIKNLCVKRNNLRNALKE